MEYRVGHLKLRPHRQLLDGTEALPIGRKALDLLSVLARAEGALVTKDELMAAVWPGVIVEENAIQVHMSALRKALGAAAEQLTTVRGLGYRLAATRADVHAGAVRDSPVAPRPSEPLIAVLAFENRSGDPDLAYFAEGVSEEILGVVARIDGLRVIARTSSFQIGGDARRPKAVAAALGATHILDGGVRRQGDRLRIGAQLVEASGETILWSERFDGAAGDVFAFQDAIAGSVATALRLRFVPPERQRPPVDPRAYDLFLQGRRLAGPPDAQRQSIELFDAALAIEPGFAEAWASLALAWATAAHWDARTGPTEAQRERASASADRALALDPSSAGAYVALTLLEPYASYRRHDELFGRALSLRPNDPETIGYHLIFLWSVGRLGEAFEAAARNRRIDPLNPLAVMSYAGLTYEMGWTEEAWKTYAFGRERWPDHYFFQTIPIILAAFAGDWDVLDAVSAKARTDRPEVALACNVADALRHPDDAKRAAVLALTDRQVARRGKIEPSQMAFLFALGLRDEAFAFAERSDYGAFFAVGGQVADRLGFVLAPLFGAVTRPMRRDPRFVRLCEKLGLNAYWRETGRWPDCADETPYDFRAAVMRAGEGA